MKRLFKTRFVMHPHIIKICGMAIGVAEHGQPVTAFKSRCILCGKEIVEIEEPGLWQLEAGYKRDQVFVWLEAK